VKRLLAALVTAGALLFVATPVQAAAAPTVASVATALQSSPVFVDPAVAASGQPTVDAARLTPVVPAGVHVAVLSAATVPTGADAAELPALLSSGVGKGGTFVVLIAGRLYGSSTTLPGQLADDLATAQAAIPKGGGDATPAVIALVRSLVGTGGRGDAAGPDRAGSPISAAALVLLAAVLVLGALALWWWLKRKPKAPKRATPAERGDLVEIDYYGDIVRITPAKDREQ
jgi:hypothetical protein